MKTASRSTSHDSYVPRILVTNDDGINAPGLKVLERIARTISKDVWVVAPEMEQSGAAHSLTLHVPVRVRKISARRYAVSGTPTDCVLLALQEIVPSYSLSLRERVPTPHLLRGRRVRAVPVAMPSSGATRHLLPEGDGKVDLVLSGVNRSSNVGDDVTYSGTVAAAMEGTVLGVPSIAFSQACDNGKVHWPTVERHASELIKKLMASGWPKNTLININFPDCPPNGVKGVKVCKQGKRLVSVALSERLDPKGRPYFWIGGERENKTDEPGVDVDLLEQGYITVTPLTMDLTDYKTIEKLRNALKL